MTCNSMLGLPFDVFFLFPHLWFYFIFPYIIVFFIFILSITCIIVFGVAILILRDGDNIMLSLVKFERSL